MRNFCNVNCVYVLGHFSSLSKVYNLDPSGRFMRIKMCAFKVFKETMGEG